jgi:hypothetical protein
MSKTDTASIGITLDEKRKPDPPRIDMDFPAGQKVQPEGFGTLTLEGEVTCTIKGTVKKLAINEWGMDNDGDKSVRIQVSSCTFSADRENPLSLDEAIEEGEKTRKRA